MNTPSTSSTVWLTKAVDTAVDSPVHVVVYTVPSLRKPPVLLVRRRAICEGKLRVYQCSSQSSTRASQAATKEMIIEVKNEGLMKTVTEVNRG